MIDEDDEEEFSGPLRFKEAVGEHVLTDDVRMAFIWASLERFLTEDEWSEVDKDEFSAQQKQLAKSVVFRGPFKDFEVAVQESIRRRGVVVAYLPEWSEEEQPCWLICLAH